MSSNDVPQELLSVLLFLQLAHSHSPVVRRLYYVPSTHLNLCVLVAVPTYVTSEQALTYINPSPAVMISKDLVFICPGHQLLVTVICQSVCQLGDYVPATDLICILPLLHNYCT